MTAVQQPPAASANRSLKRSSSSLAPGGAPKKAAAAAAEGVKQDQSSVQEERPSAADALQALHTLIGGVGIDGSTPRSSSSPPRDNGAAADTDGGTFPRLCHAAARVCGMHVAALMAGERTAACMHKASRVRASVRAPDRVTCSPSAAEPPELMPCDAPLAPFVRCPKSVRALQALIKPTAMPCVPRTPATAATTAATTAWRALAKATMPHLGRRLARSLAPRPEALHTLEELEEPELTPPAPAPAAASPAATRDTTSKSGTASGTASAGNAAPAAVELPPEGAGGAASACGITPAELELPPGAADAASAGDAPAAQSELPPGAAATLNPLELSPAYELDELPRDERGLAAEMFGASWEGLGPAWERLPRSLFQQ
jgi:hypothetical protein